jgi:hypothetical protein
MFHPFQFQASAERPQDLVGFEALLTDPAIIEDRGGRREIRIWKKRMHDRYRPVPERYRSLSACRNTVISHLSTYAPIGAPFETR